MKTQFVSAGGMILSAPRTTAGWVTGQPATTQPNDSRGSSKLCRLIGPLLAAATVLQAAVVFGGPPAYTFKPISFLGDPVPGGGTFINDYEPSGINNRGQIAFTADLSAGGEGVFLGGGGAALRQVVRAGQVAPGTGGELFGPWEWQNLGFNDEGDAAIAFSLGLFTHWWAGFNGCYGGVWRYSHVTQQVTPVMVPGDPVPGSEGGIFMGIGYGVGMNNQGTIAFEGILSVGPETALTPGFDGEVESMTAGLFLAGKHGTIRAVVVPGGPAPNGDTWKSAFNPSINAAGDMSFGAWTVGAQAGEKRESVYVRKAATGEILTVALAGDLAPGGGEFLDCDQSKINDRGDVAFTGYLYPDGGTSGFYLYTGGTLVRVAGSGDVMPGGGHFVYGSGNVGLNNSGTVAFTAALDTGEEGVYAYSRGSLRLIAKTGTVIPGLGTVSGVAFTNNPLNDRGQAVFGCDLSDGRTVLLLATPTGAK